MNTVNFYVENNGTADATNVTVNVNSQIWMIGKISEGDNKYVWMSMKEGTVNWTSPQFTITVSCREGITKRFVFSE